ncbi:MAG: hypothetical protein Kow0056_09640 [Coriobacteriia bacterium]
MFGMGETAADRGARDDRTLEGVRDSEVLRAALAELEEQTRFLRTLLDTAPIGIGAVEEGKLILANDFLSEMLGYEPRDLIGESCRMIFFSDDDYETALGARADCIRSGEAKTVFVDLACSDGTPLAARLTTSAMQPADEGSKVVFTVVDMRPLQEAQAELARQNERLREEVEARTWQLAQTNEQLRAAVEANSEFLAAVSHELRTPLNSVVGFTGVLLDELAGPINDEQRRQLGMVRDSGIRLMGLVDRILELAHIDAGERALALESFTLQEVVDELSRRFRPAAEGKGLALEIEMPAEPVHLNTDRDSVTQVLVQLVSNGVKFTDSGHVRISARAPDDGFVTVAVSDTGPGMSREEERRVFDAFQAFGRPAVDGRPDVGLGLSIAWRLATGIGGRLDVDSSPGEGSTFTFVFPVRLPDALTR